MKLDHIPLAVKSLHDCLSSFQTLDIILRETIEYYDVTELVLRVRFEKAYRCTPEEFVEQLDKADSIAKWLAAYRAEHLGPGSRQLEHFGKRFYTLSTSKNGKMERRWSRFLQNKGYMIISVDELTNEIGEMWENKYIDDVARQIGWQRWIDWPKVGPQPSLIFADLESFEKYA